MNSKTVPEALPGFLLVIEGIDGAGKSNVCRALTERCVQMGVPYIQSREPTNGPWGRKARESATTGRLSLEEELELFVRDRREHVESLILPAMREGKLVLLDRYYLSTAAYQGARGADPLGILAENEAFAPAPDVCFLLDLEPSVARGRVRGRGDVPDAFEREQSLIEVRRIFLSIERPWLTKIDASAPLMEVERRCAEALETAWIAKRKKHSELERT